MLPSRNLQEIERLISSEPRKRQKTGTKSIRRKSKIKPKVPRTRNQPKEINENVMVRFPIFEKLGIDTVDLPPIRYIVIAIHLLYIRIY